LGVEVVGDGLGEPTAHHHHVAGSRGDEVDDLVDLLGGQRPGVGRGVRRRLVEQRRDHVGVGSRRLHRHRARRRRQTFLDLGEQGALEVAEGRQPQPVDEPEDRGTPHPGALRELGQGANAGDGIAVEEGTRTLRSLGGSSP
jgi:hypothetical protein